VSRRKIRPIRATEIPVLRNNFNPALCSHLIRAYSRCSTAMGQDSFAAKQDSLYIRMDAPGNLLACGMVASY